MNTLDTEQYWQERLNKNYNLTGVGFISLGEQYNRWLYRVRKHVFLDQVSALRLSLSKCEILDIGSGTGFYIEIWQELGVKGISGLDITTIAIERLRQRFPELNFFRTDISGNVDNLANEKFDLISAMDVLFHIIDDNLYHDALENIYSLLNPGGYLILSENMLHTGNLRAPHQVSRSIYQVETILQNCGFEIKMRAPMFYWMNSPIDSNSRLHLSAWKLLSRMLPQSEWVGFLIGALLYPIELLSVKLFRKSPSTEIVICQRPLTP